MPLPQHPGRGRQGPQRRDHPDHARRSTRRCRAAATRSPTRAAPRTTTTIGGDILATGGFGKKGARVANFEYQRKCPNAQNLIAIIGDSDDPDRECDVKCNIQIQGMGRRRADVKISGQRTKLNLIRADRADGIHLRNFTVEFSDFNNVYILETNGFAMHRIQSRYSREYGFLSFTSDHGLYDRLEAFGSGDSGIYPGSGPEGHCERYGIEIRNVNSHHNTMGYSGTAGNGVWAHDNKLPPQLRGPDHGLLRRRAPGHAAGLHEVGEQPDLLQQRGLLQRRARRVLQEHADPEARPEDRVPDVPGPGRHRHRHLRRQRQHRPRQLHLRQLARRHQAALRPGGVPRRTGQGHRHVVRQPFAANHMGVRPDGTPDANGNDFWWDEQGKGNCWGANTSHSGLQPSSNVAARAAGLPGLAIVSARQQRQDGQPGVLLDLGSVWRTATRPAATGSPARPSRRTTVRHQRRRPGRWDWHARLRRLGRPGVRCEAA